MAATPAQIWALVGDVTRIGEFSPETFDAEWLDGANGPAVGARFRGHVKRNGRGPVYWTACTVTRCDPERDFAWSVEGPRGKVLNSWGYHLEAGDAGTEVTEWFELPDMPLTRIYWMVAGRARGRTNARGMRTTLERIRAVVEAGGD